MVHKDCLGAGIKIHCGLSLFLEGIGARLFESADSSLIALIANQNSLN